MKDNWFSNFIRFETPMVYDGVFYSTPEHFFQAMKTQDRKQRKFVASRKTPSAAKRAGRKINLRKDWKKIKPNIMEFVQRYRFESESKMMSKLVNSTGPIVEWVTWHDKTWGKCICPKCNGRGKNMLGKILMKLRAEYRS